MNIYWPNEYFQSPILVKNQCLHNAVALQINLRKRRDPMPSARAVQALYRSLPAEDSNSGPIKEPNAT